MAFTVEHVKRLLQRDLVTELEKVKIAKGSSIKDFRTNLGIFGTPPYACPGLSAFGWPPPPPARADTRLALFETLQLVSNSHWRVKKTDHSDTGCTHVCSSYTTSIIAFQKMGLSRIKCDTQVWFAKQKCKCSKIIIWKKKRFYLSE